MSKDRKKKQGERITNNKHFINREISPWILTKFRWRRKNRIHK